MIRIYLMLITLGILLSNCNGDTIPAGAHSFENNSWSYDAKIPFEFELDDTSSVYDLVLVLRNTNDYKYSNLFVSIEESPPYGESYKSHHEIPIANPDGSWIGNKSGSIIENKYLIRRGTFPFIGKYKYSIQHAITDESVEEVMDLTLLLTKYNGN
jgi:gliding motility-associated lipoprotein GldH